MVKCNGICAIFILCTSVSHPAQSQLNMCIIIMYALSGKATKRMKKRNVLTHRGASCHCVDFFYVFLISLSTRVTRFPASRVHLLPLARVSSLSLPSSALVPHISRRSWNWFWVQCVRSGCCRQCNRVFFFIKLRRLCGAESAHHSPDIKLFFSCHDCVLFVRTRCSMVNFKFNKKICMDKCGANGYNLSHWLRRPLRSLGNSRSFSEW